MVREAMARDARAVWALTNELEEREFDFAHLERVFLDKLAASGDLILVEEVGGAAPCEDGPSSAPASTVPEVADPEAAGPSVPAVRPMSAPGVRGYIHLRFEEQLHHEGVLAEVMELVVAGGARGAGVGGALLEAAIEAARRRGCEQIELTSNARRTRAHAFYERHGFVKTHVKLCMPLDGGAA